MGLFDVVRGCHNGMMLTRGPRPPVNRPILDALIMVARPIIREHFRPDSCIASTRVTIDVLRYFGILAEPLPVNALVFNPEAAAMIVNGSTDADVAEKLATQSDADTGGVWSVGVGMGSPAGEGKWAGHLVAAIPEQQIVVDLSLDQASRPHKNMVLSPYWAHIGDMKWWAGETRFPHSSADGSLVWLGRGCANPNGFTDSPNWRKQNQKLLFTSMVGQIIRKIRSELAT